MGKPLIVKTGATFDSIKKEYGDFDDFIVKNMGLARKDVFVWPVYQKLPAPEWEDVSAVIITGSHSMVTDNEDWSLDLCTWVKSNRWRNIPTLGICYGHQLIARAFGGEVGYHPGGKELGTVKIALTEEGIRDPLLGVLPEVFEGHVTHAQTVWELPPRARILARNDFERHQAFVIDDCIWGVQFHPEFNAGITLGYLEEQKTGILEGGRDFASVQQTVREHLYGRMLLERFLELSL
ncbi:glutamine amidotransferase [Candidatus Formimonas warabiya]|uniref:GMP synthase n=1 Tax=Formimonas warabiya TaxID=1761012 RepID=A0A3G1KVX2_FORW1|nr:glutamine amidotransferase [Candidatus Formimonas warabiya]ATW26509.1 GMP synthase [Candidatus Formimonas warabiya]